MEGKKIKGMLTVAGGFIIGYLVVNQFLFKKPVFDEVMMQTASELNKNCPIMVDAETRLDNAIALPKNVFQYNYTLVKMKREEIDTSFFTVSLRPVILNNIKTNPDLEKFRENDVTMNYYYKDKEGVFLYKFSFEPKEYK